MGTTDRSVLNRMNGLRQLIRISLITQYFQTQIKANKMIQTLMAIIIDSKRMNEN